MENPVEKCPSVYFDFSALGLDCYPLYSAKFQAYPVLINPVLTILTVLSLTVPFFHPQISMWRVLWNAPWVDVTYCWEPPPCPRSECPSRLPSCPTIDPTRPLLVPRNTGFAKFRNFLTDFKSTFLGKILLMLAKNKHNLMILSHTLLS